MLGRQDTKRSLDAAALLTMLCPDGVCNEQRLSAFVYVQQMFPAADPANAAGMLLALDGLHPPGKATSVSFDGEGVKAVTDGPFTEAKEVVGGYWIIQASSQEEAVQWARRCPADDGDMIEVRPIQQYPDEAG